MTEDEARSRIREQFGVSRETLLSRYAELLVAAAGEQNLIAASTLPMLWSRHMLDSAQLVDWAAGDEGVWLDVGSGAGLPGLVVAILTDRPVVLCEPRARRVEFLNHVVDGLGLRSRVAVQGLKVENFLPIAPVAVVSARAVAALSSLLQSTVHCTDLSTVWVLPKGRNAHSEVEAAKRKWQGTFHVEPSVTEPESGIVIARGVRPR